ncbi:vomeronasal 1 receptor ornAnaV1R3025 [Ornithorhynchus anatinus]|uniref:Vomeronasal type-1 receptor n=1 Tax=Ornithorhynchus anatinus TaxID=9258 RepID=A0A6I8N4Z6_ORNAN|nr:vomeronasal 1 receptor ornAnaV1R3025 [Ornithorhynchus anatinus]
MEARDIPFGTVMLFQIGIGVSVNIFLLLFYAREVSGSHKPSSSDLILAHLALANTVILLTYGIPETMSIWGWRNFLDVFGCKICMYVYRVGRGLAICTTCLLSVFQAVTISPSTTPWAGIKAKLPKCIIPFCVLSWVLNLLIDLSTPIHMTSPQNSSLVRVVLDLKYCSKVIASAEKGLIIAVALSLRDLFFVVLMSAASGYMVFVLQRHHRRVRHLHGPGRSPKTMPEVRAAKKVIALVTLYVLLYGRQSVTLSVILNMKEKSPLLMNTHMVLAFTFSAISPFLMAHGDRRIGTFWKKGSPVSNPGAP